MSITAYESTVVVHLGNVQMKSVMTSAIKLLQQKNPRIQIEHEDESLAILRWGLNWDSFGERARITLEPGAFRIVSACIFPIQLTDWGKNRKNVEMVRECILAAMQHENFESTVTEGQARNQGETIADTRTTASQGSAKSIAESDTDNKRLQAFMVNSVHKDTSDEDSFVVHATSEHNAKVKAEVEGHIVTSVNSLNVGQLRTSRDDAANQKVVNDGSVLVKSPTFSPAMVIIAVIAVVIAGAAVYEYESGRSISTEANTSSTTESSSPPSTQSSGSPTGRYLRSGGYLCATIESANRMRVRESTGAYMAVPYDCDFASERIPIADIDYHPAGFYYVRLTTGTMYGYTLRSQIR